MIIELLVYTMCIYAAAFHMNMSLCFYSDEYK